MPVNPFIAYLQNQAGPALRSVVWYTYDDDGIVYLRDDLDPEFANTLTAEGLSAMAPDAGRSDDTLIEQFGPTRAMVDVRDEIVIMRFPVDDQGRVAVSLESHAALNLHSFVVECADRLSESDLTPPAAES